MARKKDKPAEFVVYRTQTGDLMRAKVITRHPNGWLRVEPYFWQKEGKDVGAFQGGHQVPVLPSHLVR